MTDEKSDNHNGRRGFKTFRRGPGTNVPKPKTSNIDRITVAQGDEIELCGINPGQQNTGRGIFCV